MQDSVLCGGWLPPCLGLIRLYGFIVPGTPVGLLWFNSHYQCPTHVGLSLTLPVAHWPQLGTKHTNPLWSQNASWTIVWHLLPSHEVAKGMSYSARGINPADNTQYLSISEYGMDTSDDPLSQINMNRSPVREKIKHTCNIESVHTSQIIRMQYQKGFHYIRLYILMHLTLQTMDRAAFYNPFTQFLCFLIHGRKGV